MRSFSLRFESNSRSVIQNFHSRFDLKTAAFNLGWRQSSTCRRGIKAANRGGAGTTRSARLEAHPKTPFPSNL